MSDLNEYGETLEEVSRSRNNWEHMAGKYLKWRDQHRDRADALERKLKLCVEALEHCIDLGPPCPACGAEDEESEGMGFYPHAEDCIAFNALEEAGK